MGRSWLDSQLYEYERSDVSVINWTSFLIEGKIPLCTLWNEQGPRSYFEGRGGGGLTSDSKWEG